jgi:hypothetical protein
MKKIKIITKPKANKSREKKKEREKEMANVMIRSCISSR